MLSKVSQKRGKIKQGSKRLNFKAPEPPPDPHLFISHHYNLTTKLQPLFHVLFKSIGLLEL